MNLSTENLESIKRGEPIPITAEGMDLVVLRADVYARANRPAEYDDSDWTHDEMESLAAEMFDQMDNPEKIQ